MTEAPHGTGSPWAEFCDDVCESVYVVRTAAIETTCRAG